MKLEIYKEERPWGNFERFTLNQVSSVKILTVKAGEELSLQKHHKREEFWRILSGTGSVVVGEEIISAHSGDEFFIPIETNHTIKAEEEMKVLEISLGEFEEGDIVRISDKYNRI